ncbi:MAG: VOC family protein [Bacteroidota bacterium]|nr:VOC family protein [Bacteroidota bacterium]
MTKNPKIPQNYQTVMPYLIIKDAVKFIEFTEKVFGATLTQKAMRNESVIMHGEIMIGESTIMFADATEDYNTRPVGLFVYVSNADEIHKKALEAGATIISQVADQDYGRSGGVTDPFGNTWWITSLK